MFIVGPCLGIRPIGPTSPHAAWTAVNAGEALPGVSTPLTWTFYSEAISSPSAGPGGTSACWPRARSTCPGLRTSGSSACFAPVVTSLDAMRAVADRVPGMSGEKLEEQLFGTVRPRGGEPPFTAALPLRGGQGARWCLAVRSYPETAAGDERPVVAGVLGPPCGRPPAHRRGPRPLLSHHRPSVRRSNAGAGRLRQGGPNRHRRWPSRSRAEAPHRPRRLRGSSNDERPVVGVA